MRTRQNPAAAVLSCLAIVALLWWGLSDDSEPSGPGEPVVAEAPSMTPAPATPLGTGRANVREPLEPDASLAPTDDVAASSKPPTSIALNVLHADGQPARGVRVAVAGSVDSAESGSTWQVWDVDGSASVIGWEAGTPLWVAGASDRPQECLPVFEVDNGTIANVQLPSGGGVAGHVTVDGAAPTGPIELALAGSRPRPGTYQVLDTLDARLLQALHRDDSKLNTYLQPVIQRVGTDGIFRFTGLGDGWRGRLHFPPEYLCDGRWGNLHLSEVDNSLELQLTTCPVIEGIALHIDGTPAAGAEVSSTLLGQAIPMMPRRETPGPRCQTDDAGHFRLPCGWDDTEEAVLRIESVDREAAADVDVPGAWREAGIDIGLVHLLPTRDLELEIVDPSGSPVADARAIPRDVMGRLALREASKPTDDLGRSVVTLDDDTEVLSIQAPRHSAAEVNVGGVDVTTGPARVVVWPCASLELVLDDAAGGRKTRWVLAAAEDIVEDSSSFAPSDARTLVGVSVFNGMSMRTDGSVDPPRISGSLQYRATDGPVFLSCLRPEVLFDLSVQNHHDQTIWSRTDLVLQAGQHLRITASLSKGSVQPVSGVVVDPNGEPIPNATVFVGPAGEMPLNGVSTKQDGTFTFNTVAGGRFRIEVQKIGFAPLTVEPTETQLRLVMQPES